MSMRYFPSVSDGSKFSRTRLLSYRFIVTSYHTSLIFSSTYKQTIFKRMHITRSGIEDFSSSRRPIDNLSVWTRCPFFHSTLMESDLRDISLFEKRNKTLEFHWYAISFIWVSVVRRKFHVDFSGSPYAINFIASGAGFPVW